MASPVYNGAANFSHLHGSVELEFSFKVPASGAVSVIRDGKGAQVASVSAYASGVYTVTFNDRVRMPRQLTSFEVSLSQPADGGTWVRAALVTDSLNVSARTVQVVTSTYNGAASVLQAATGSWVSVRLKGPTRDDIKDAA